MNKEVIYYSVCDLVAHMFGPMFPAVNDGVAKRMFKKLLSDVDNPSEYQLWNIGVFNQESGDFVPSPVHVCAGVDVMEVIK